MRRNRQVCSILAVCALATSSNVWASDIGVAKWRYGRTAAASFTIDDGHHTAYEICAPEFEKHGLRASFFINAGRIQESDWGNWKALADSGHEIANHGMNHVILQGVDETVLKTEVLDARDKIEEKIGVRPVTFGYPNTAMDSVSRAYALSCHLVDRPMAEDWRTYGKCYGGSSFTTQQANDWYDDYRSQGVWFVALWHYMDSDGYLPLSTTVFKEHLDYVDAHSDDVWIDVYGTVGRYFQERLNAEIVMGDETAESVDVTVSLPGDMYTRGFNVPLTLVIANGSDTLLYDIVPDGQEKTIPFADCYTSENPPTRSLPVTQVRANQAVRLRGRTLVLSNARAGMVRIELRRANGQLVCALLQQQLSAGIQAIPLSRANVPAGVHLIRVLGPSLNRTIRLVDL